MTKKLLLFSLLTVGYCSLLFSCDSNKSEKNIFLNPAKNNSIAKQDSIPVSILDTLNYKVYPQFQVTYIELLKKIFYDIQTDKDGLIALKTIPIQNIVDQYTKTAFEDTFKISSLQKLIIKSSGKPLVLLICQANFQSGQNPLDVIAEGITVMGLFDPISGKLLDAVDVASDKFTNVGEINAQYTLPLSTKQEAVAIWNTHNNSSQGYNKCSILTIVDNKIKVVFNFFILNYKLACEEFEATPHFIFSKKASKLFGDIFISVRGKTIKNYEEDCKGKKSTIFKNYKSHLIWNNAQKVYLDQLKDFNKLDKQNNVNF
jgi:hypothetical protein